MSRSRSAWRIEPDLFLTHWLNWSESLVALQRLAASQKPCALPLALTARMLSRRMSTRQTSSKVAGTELFARSRITNGRGLLYDVDLRSAWARRLRDVIQLHTDDRGGDEALSESERTIIRRAATLTVELEFQEAKLAQLRAEGREPSADTLDLYARLAGHLRRLLESIGMGRRARDIGRAGTLEPYL